MEWRLIAVIVSAICTLRVAEGKGGGRSRGGGGYGRSIPVGVPVAGYSMPLGLGEMLAGYLAVCDLGNKCISAAQAAQLQACFTQFKANYPSLSNRFNICAVCCQLDCTPANVQKFVPCFATQLAPTLGSMSIPETAICCIRNNLSLTSIDCLKGLYPTFAQWISDVSTG